MIPIILALRMVLANKRWFLAVKEVWARLCIFPISERYSVRTTVLAVKSRGSRLSW